MSELKKAVITGATSGIGFALAQALAQSGRQVLAIGRNPDNLAKLKEAGDIATLAIARLFCQKYRNFPLIFW